MEVQKKREKNTFNGQMNKTRALCPTTQEAKQLQEKKEEMGSPQEQPGIPEDNSSQRPPHNNSLADAAKGLWAPSGDNKEDLEPRVNEASVKKNIQRTPLCLGPRSLVSCVWKVFKKAPPSEPSTSGVQAERRLFGMRLRIRQHSSCVHPEAL
ncbi:Hypothetical predicted protein [Podarcis lilfordi]|uniref:Uncharacterized protein n=1 Tax=Podarcis lilfordi TaxID=74358 RepID=A0AA35L4C8_9SAUR|nr:Hypothetical predicted protein [Podarcis lilfordi]